MSPNPSQVADLSKLVFEGKLSSKVQWLGYTVELELLSSLQETQVETHPRLKQFAPSGNDAIPQPGSLLERMKVTLSEAVKSVDGSKVESPEAVLLMLDERTATQVYALGRHYNELVTRETEATKEDILKNSSTTPHPGSSGQ